MNNPRFDVSKLLLHLVKPIENYYPIGQVVNTSNGMYIYQDNKADVLLVAHLDSVPTAPCFQVLDNDVLLAPNLDDRLGAYTILDVLPNYIEADILLTENEEIGQSTARHFEPSHQYNWIFEFDRRGTDLVMYQYDNSQARALLETMGNGEIGIGSYTDIVDLGYLNTMAINWGIGFYNEHTDQSCMSISAWAKQVEKFLGFYEYAKDIVIDFNDPTLEFYDPYLAYDLDDYGDDIAYDDTIFAEQDRIVCPVCWRKPIEYWEECCFDCALALDNNLSDWWYREYKTGG
jgi:hypothetical protein